MHRSNTSHRWNGKKKVEKQGDYGEVGKVKTLTYGTMGGMENARTRVIYRISDKSSTTANQRFGLDRHVRGLGYTPDIIDIKATNWTRPIPEMEQLKRDIANGMLDEVHFWAVDRAGRDHHYDVDLWKLCVKHEVLLWFIGDDVRSDRYDDEETFNDLSLKGWKERRQISKRTKLAFRRTKAEWVAKTFPNAYSTYLGLLDEDEKDESQKYPKTTAMYKELLKQWAKDHPDESRPCGGGKMKGNIQKKTIEMTPVVLNCLKAGQSMRSLSKTLDMAYHCILGIKRRAGLQ